MSPSNIGRKQYPNKLPNSGFCGGHYFTWETCIFRRIYSRKQRSRVIRQLVKANTYKKPVPIETETGDWNNAFYLQVYFVNTEKDAQLITLIIIVNRSV